MHKHLTRIPVWTPADRTVIYFVTCCTAKRQPCLGSRKAHEAALKAWQAIADWQVGRYVLMPDHLHFFVSPSDRETDLSKYVQAFRALVTRQLKPCGFPYPLWRRELFDHLLRSDESYERKWQYVLENPVRQKLVSRVQNWPFAGEVHPLTR